MAEPPRGGPLVLSAPAGERVVVATDRMHLAHERCEALVRSANTALLHLDAAGPMLPQAASIELAQRRLRRARELADDLAVRIAATASAYEASEELLERSQRFAAGWLTTLAGLGVHHFGLLPLLANPWLLGGIVGALVGRKLVPPRPEGAPGPFDWLVQNPQLITSPEFASLVGLIATSSDDTVLGLLGAPPGVSLLLGEDGLGLTGVAFGAAAVLGAAKASGSGLLTETPVAVTRASERHGEEGAPAGSAERLRRVPDGEAQLRVERYDVRGEAPRWIVYVGPTYDFALSSDNPFDMTSNVHGVAGGSPASFRALELALADAGVAATDEVQFVGFSHGGIIAARAAESGQWNAVALESYGAPLGGIELPEGLSGIAVRHTDDLVPVTGGPDVPESLIHVERRAFLPGEPMPAIAAPAHQRSSYLATAALIDAAESGLLRDEVARLDAFGADYLAAGGTMTVLEYHAERRPAT